MRYVGEPIEDSKKEIQNRCKSVEMQLLAQLIYKADWQKTLR